MIVPRHEIDVARIQKYYLKEAARVPPFLEGGAKSPTISAS